MVAESSSRCPAPAIFAILFPNGFYGPKQEFAGAKQLMDDRTSKPDASKANPARELRWTVDRAFQGWTCSQCEWNDPIPTLLNDPEAKTAYDRLAAAKFRQHRCEDHAIRLPSLGLETFTARIRKLVAQGFKPKDAVELMLQEVAIENPGQPKILAQAKAEGEDFLRRLRAGLI